MLSSDIEQTLNADKDQRENANSNPGPPGAQGAVVLEDRYDRALD